MPDCFYKKDGCAASHADPSPPAGWSEVKCYLCREVIGHACPTCSAIENCISVCDLPDDAQNPPPTQSDPAIARGKDRARRQKLRPPGGPLRRPPS